MSFFQIKKSHWVQSFWVNIRKFNSTPNPTETALNKLKSEGYRIVATTLHEKAVTLENFDLSTGKTAIIFGTERTGITDTVKSMADEFLTIPMFGFTESFNVSVSAAIILHYLTLKLHNSEINWKLSKEEQDEIKIKWLRHSLKKPDLLEQQFYETYKIAE